MGFQKAGLIVWFPSEQILGVWFVAARDVDEMRDESLDSLIELIFDLLLVPNDGSYVWSAPFVKNKNMSAFPQRLLMYESTW